MTPLNPAFNQDSIEVPFLDISGVSKEEEKKPILQNISFTQQKFQKIAVAGETGSGKSTVLKIVAGLQQPSAGKVHFLGERVRGPQEQLVAGHPEIAYLSQHFELPAFLRVEQVLRYVNSLDAAAADTLYKICQVTHLLQRRTDELSGGERQRIALARLLSTSPSLLLLDEPYSNLDLIHKNQLKDVVQDIGEQLGITCILISHDPLDTLSWADEILVLHAGKLVQKGTPQQIYLQPENEYVAGLFGKYNVLTNEQMAAFGLAQADAKSPFIRPEAFQVATSGIGVLGQISAITYYGSYQEITVQVSGAEILVRTEEKKLTTGSEIRIALSKHNLL